MKKNAQVQVVTSNPIADTGHVLSDDAVAFTRVCASQDYPDLIRKITYWDEETDKQLIFLTNDFDLDAQTIADVYKARWEIELFFKTIKQNLKIKRFMGTSRNAAWTQVWIALIAYLLVSYQKFTIKSKYSIQKIFRLIQINLFERKPLTELLWDRIFKLPDQINKAQICLFQT
jgi:putative transposase